MPLTNLQDFITESNIKIEKSLGSPTITWNNNTYICIPSVSSFTRALEEGGYEQVQLMTTTIRRFNEDGSSVFTNLPQAQQKLIYNIDGRTYRIASVHIDPSQSYIRIIAESAWKGI